MPSSKRQRSQSPSDEGPSGPESEKTQPNKFLRTEPASDVEGEVIHCTLPPTCNPPNKPTSLFGVEELEAHYSKYHAFVCNAEACHAVFDREHYLGLHQTEFHDPLAALRKVRGENIYKCLLPDCPQTMPSINSRRKHLIESHYFEPSFFFAVIKYGIGNQLRAWAAGGTRSELPNKAATSAPMKVETEQDNSARKSRSRSKDRRKAKETVTEASASTSQQQREEMSHTGDTVDSMTDKMKNISLVPSSVRFGRGGRHAGFERTKVRNRDVQVSYSETVVDEDIDVDEAGTSSEEGPTETKGVRFSDNIGIRFLSPIDPNFNHEHFRGRNRRGGRGRGRGGKEDRGSKRRREIREA